MRDSISLITSNHWREYVIPSRKTTGEFFRFTVYLDKVHDLATNQLVSFRFDAAPNLSIMLDTPYAGFDQVTLDAQLLCSLPDAQSVVVLAGIFGKNVPEHELRISPEQLLLPVQKGGKGEMCSARSLLGRPGVTRHHETAITYTRFRLPKPSLVRCEGVWLAAG